MISDKQIVELRLQQSFLARNTGEQKYVYLEIARHFFRSKELEEITGLMNSTDNVVGWVNPA